MILAFVLSLTASAQDRNAGKKDVRAAMLSAFANIYPKEQVNGHAREAEEGKTYFEIESRNGKASPDVLYLADGTVAEVEEGLGEADLPSSVTEAVSARHSDVKIVKAEKTTRGGAVTYELVVTSGIARIGVVVDSNGRIVKEAKKDAKNVKKDRKDNMDKEND